MKTRLAVLATTVATAVAIALPLSLPAFAQTDVPEPIRVPAGHKAFMTVVGAGDLTYECKANADKGGAMEWTFAGPQAKLTDAKTNKEVGKYYAGPTWEALDGSKITGKQLAVAPAAAGNIPMQLVKTEWAAGR